MFHHTHANSPIQVLGAALSRGITMIRLMILNELETNMAAIHNIGEGTPRANVPLFGSLLGPGHHAP